VQFPFSTTFSETSIARDRQIEKSPRAVETPAPEGLLIDISVTGAGRSRTKVSSESAHLITTRRRADKTRIVRWP
jgi:hypothetical protein